MRNHKLKIILEELARKNHTTPEQIRKEMQFAIKEGQKSRDPFIQARWAAIPRKGKELTLEEFVEYLAKQL